MTSLNMQRNTQPSYSGWNDCPSFIERSASISSLRSKKRVSSGSSIVYNAINGPLPPNYSPGSNNTSPQNSVNNSPVTSYYTTFHRDASVSPPLRAVTPEYFFLNNESAESKEEMTQLDSTSNGQVNDDVNDCKANLQKLLNLPTTLSFKEFQYHCNKLTSNSVSESQENRIFLNEISSSVLNDVHNFNRELLLNKVVEFMMKNSNISWCTSLKRILSSIQM